MAWICTQLCTGSAHALSESHSTHVGTSLDSLTAADAALPLHMCPAHMHAALLPAPTVFFSTSNRSSLPSHHRFCAARMAGRGRGGRRDALVSSCK